MTSILDSLYKRNDIEAEFDPFFEVIEEVATGKEGSYSNCSFEELMKLEWFSKAKKKMCSLPKIISALCSVLTLNDSLTANC